MIIKVNTNEPFTRVSNNIIQNCNLSVQSMGVLLFLKSLPSNWRPNTKHLCKTLKLSKRTLWKYINELVVAGVLEIARIRVASGQLTDEYAFLFKEPHQEPQILELTKPQAQKPQEAQEQNGGGFLNKEKGRAFFKELKKTTPQKSGLFPPAGNLNKLSPVDSSMFSVVDSTLLSDEGSTSQDDLAANSLANLLQEFEKNPALVQKQRTGVFAPKTLTNPAGDGVPATSTKSAHIKINMYSKKKHDFSCERACACEAPEVQESTEKTRSVCLAKEKSFIVGTLEKFKQLADMCFNFDTSALEPHEVQALENFVSYRREHSRLSYGSKKAILERMLELKEKGEDLEACVAYSMRRGYRDLFPLISPAIDRLEDQDFEDQFHPLWEDRASLRARGREMLESMEEYGEEYGLCDFDSMSEEAFGFDDEEFYGKEGWVEL